MKITSVTMIRTLSAMGGSSILIGVIAGTSYEMPVLRAILIGIGMISLIATLFFRCQSCGHLLIQIRILQGTPLESWLMVPWPPPRCAKCGHVEKS